MSPKEIVERIMSQHWDMAQCNCWVCKNGRDADCKPREEYLRHKSKVKLASVIIMQEMKT